MAVLQKQMTLTHSKLNNNSSSAKVDVEDYEEE